MTASFDESGNLWIEIEGDLHPEVKNLDLQKSGSFTAGGEGCWGPTKLNLTAYIRSLSKPDWLNAALTSSSANVTVEQKAVV